MGIRNAKGLKSFQTMVSLSFGDSFTLSRITSLISGSFVKFALVGSSGTVVNLAALTLLVRTTTARGWMASAIASLIANASNYVLNNFWTFSERYHRGLRLIRGYASYLVMSSVGLAITTVLYAFLARNFGQISLWRGDRNGLSGSLLCQVIAILLGGYFNYVLNKKVTWSISNGVKSHEGTPAD